MSDADEAGPSALTPGGKGVKRKRGMADSSAIVEGLLAVFRGTLVSVLNEEQVDKALTAAKKHPSFKAMMASVGGKGRGGGGGGGKAGGDAAGAKAIRSAYMAFTTVAMSQLKAAGHADIATVTTVGTTWKKLPPSVKARVEERLSAFRDHYNAALAAGKEMGNLPDELAKFEREKGADSIDFNAMIIKYKDAELPPAADGAAAKAPAAKAPAAAKALVPAPTPAPAVTPVATKAKEGGDAGHKSHKKHKDKSHKKDKKEKKHRAEESD